MYISIYLYSYVSLYLFIYPSNISLSLSPVFFFFPCLCGGGCPACTHFHTRLRRHVTHNTLRPPIVFVFDFVFVSSPCFRKRMKQWSRLNRLWRVSRIYIIKGSSSLVSSIGRYKWTWFSLPRLQTILLIAVSFLDDGFVQVLLLRRSFPFSIGNVCFVDLCFRDFRFFVRTFTMESIVLVFRGIHSFTIEQFSPTS